MGSASGKGPAFQSNSGNKCEKDGTPKRIRKTACLFPEQARRPLCLFPECITVAQLSAVFVRAKPSLGETL